MNTTIADEIPIITIDKLPTHEWYDFQRDDWITNEDSNKIKHKELRPFICIILADRVIITHPDNLIAAIRYREAHKLEILNMFNTYHKKNSTS